MLLRVGTGRLKHMSTKQVWAQGAVAAFGIQVHKIPRSINSSDVRTHALMQRAGVEGPLCSAWDFTFGVLGKTDFFHPSTSV